MSIYSEALVWIEELQTQNRIVIKTLRDMAYRNRVYRDALELIAEGASDNNHAQHCTDHRRLARKALAAAEEGE